jgi:hypothetical protein
MVLTNVEFDKYQYAERPTDRRRTSQGKPEG